jgi:hypothetical protein
VHRCGERESTGKREIDIFLTMFCFNGRLCNVKQRRTLCKSLYIKPFRSFCAFRSLLLPSVRLSVRQTAPHRGKPPHRQPSQLPYIAIEHFNLLIYNIYNTHTIIGDISKVLKYHSLYFAKTDIKSTENAKVFSWKWEYFVKK